MARRLYNNVKTVNLVRKTTEKLSQEFQKNNQKCSYKGKNAL